MNGFLSYMQTSDVSTCCFTLALFLSPCVSCSVSAGFIVVLPRKPGKVTDSAESGRVKSASPFAAEGARRLLLSHTCFDAAIAKGKSNFEKGEAQQKAALRRGCATCEQVSPSSCVPAVICLVLRVTNCTT